MRSAVVSDLKTAAASKVLKRFPRVLQRRRRRRQPQRRDEGSEETPAGPEARAVSRRALRRRAVRGARRRPDLAFRFAAAVFAAAGRGMSSVRRDTVMYWIAG